MATVFDYARALAKALRESDERRQMKSLGARVAKDAKLEKLLADYRLAQFEIHAAQLQGQEPGKAQIERLQQLTRSIEREQLLREYLAAEAAYGQALVEVEQILSDEYNPDVPGSVRHITRGG